MYTSGRLSKEKMTTKTTITLSPTKRYHGTIYARKRRLLPSAVNRKQQLKLPDLVHDILVEQHKKEAITNIAMILREVGDQIDEQLQISNSLLSSIDNIFRQRTKKLVHGIYYILRLFL